MEGTALGKVSNECSALPNETSAVGKISKCPENIVTVRDPPTEVKSHSPNDRFVIALHSRDGNFQTGLPVCRPEKRAAKLAF